MNKKTVTKIIIILVAVLLNLFMLRCLKVELFKGQTSLKIDISVEKDSYFQLFRECNNEFLEEMSFKSETIDNKDIHSVIFATIDKYDNILRLDLGDVEQTVKIYKVSLQNRFFTQNIELESILDYVEIHDVASLELDNECITVICDGEDPYIVFEVENESRVNTTEKKNNIFAFWIKIIICIAIDYIALRMVLDADAIRELPKEVLQSRKLILSLAKNDFKTKYAGSYLGIVWAFVQPLITTVVYWFVFEVGMRAGAMCDYPFVIWLMAGLVPWFFFSDALNGGTNALLEYNYLVKKVVFQISILPIVKIISSLFVNLFFIGLLIVLAWIYGYNPDLYTLQIVYYMICLFILVLGLSYLTSAIVGFFRDLTQIINVILQVGIWITPIMWDASNMLSPLMHKIFMLNPMYYIVSGFREALLSKTWFWENSLWTIYFWIITLFIYGIGTSVFRKLRVHFADVL